MMGHHPPGQETLFYANIMIEDRVRKNHPLRRIDEIIDFEFIYKEVKDKYGSNGQVSVPPPVILKLMLLLVFYNVRSERELMETVPERIDWLWFLGYNFDSVIPDHSVLSKARKRWGQATFKSFFERIVFQCVEAGLVDGKKIFMDASLIDADASNNSVIDIKSLKRYLHRGYQELEKRLEEKEAVGVKDERQYISSTDYDASDVRHCGTDRRLRYKTHRTVDAQCEVITAVDVTTGTVHEGHQMFPLIGMHEVNTECKVETVIADSQYGTKENFLACHDQKIKAHMPIQAKACSPKDIFLEEAFTYDQQMDCFICPAGKTLKKLYVNKKRQTIEYGARMKDCSTCALRPECTKSKRGRTLHRHVRQDELNIMFAASQTLQAKRDLKMRQHMMERSFARSYRFGFDRARWRGLWKVSIQEYLISTIQNIQTLIWNATKPKTKALALPLNHEPSKIIIAVKSSARALLNLSCIQVTKDNFRNLFESFLHRFSATEYFEDCHCL